MNTSGPVFSALRDPKRRRLLLTGFVLIALFGTREPGYHYDFCAYYTAGLLWQEDEPERAYSASEITLRHNELHASDRRTGAFLYSPVYLLPSAVFAALPFRTAERLNHWLTLVSLTMMSWFLLQRCRNVSVELAVVATVLLCHAVEVQFKYQNWSFLLAALLAAAWYFTERGRIGPAALSWALGVHLKVVAVLLLIPLALARKRRLLIGVAAVGIGLALVSTLLTGPAAWTAWVDTLTMRSAEGVVPFHNKVSLQATTARFLTEPLSWITPRGTVDHPLIRWMFPLSLPFYVALLWRRRDNWQLGVALTVPYLLLFVPQTWEHSEVLLLLVIPGLATVPALILAALLSLGWFYTDVMWNLAVGVHRDGDSGMLWRLVMLYYPLLNVFALVALLRWPGGGVEAAAREIVGRRSVPTEASVEAGGA